MVLAFFCSCENKKTKEVSLDEEVLELEDSLDTHAIVSVEEDTIGDKISEYVYEFFGDFVYDFATDEKLQMLRTIFPLSYTKDGNETLIAQSEWEHDFLFADMDYYAFLFEQEEDMELEKDTTQDAVTIEYIYADSCRIKNYNFIRENGLWSLNNIKEHKLESNDNYGFICFFHRFANDSVYQSQHIREPLKFVTVDPEDDFNILEATIDIEQWFAFLPPLPKNLLVNLNYGQKYSQKSNQKILALKGVNDGFNNTFYFRRIGGEWRLTQFEDISN